MMFEVLPAEHCEAFTLQIYITCLDSNHVNDGVEKRGQSCLRWSAWKTYFGENVDIGCVKKLSHFYASV